MADGTRMKVSVQRTEQFKNKDGTAYQEHVVFDPDFGDSPENQEFFAATPSLQFDVYISNPHRIGFFKPGEKFYVDFTKAGD